MFLQLNNFDENFHRILKSEITKRLIFGYIPHSFFFFQLLDKASMYNFKFYGLTSQYFILYFLY